MGGASKTDPDVANGRRGARRPEVVSAIVPDLTGKMLAARRESLGLTQHALALELLRQEEQEDLQSTIRWIQRIESTAEYRGRTAPTRARYRRVLEILGFDRDEPALEILTAEMEDTRRELTERFESLRTLMLRILERLDGPSGL